MSSIKIYNNFISDEIFQNLKKEIFSDGFPWFYTGTTLGDNTDSDQFGYSFFHNALYSNGDASFIGEQLKIIITLALNLIGEPINQMLRIRIGLITCTDFTKIHLPHVDMPFAHKTGLFYFNKCNGDTLIYKEKYCEGYNKIVFDKKVRSQQNEILQTITPEENKLVIFNGLMYHSSSSQTNTDRRVVINFNYV